MLISPDVRTRRFPQGQPPTPPLCLASLKQGDAGDEPGPLPPFPEHQELTGAEDGAVGTGNDADQQGQRGATDGVPARSAGTSMGSTSQLRVLPRMEKTPSTTPTLNSRAITAPVP